MGFSEVACCDNCDARQDITNDMKGWLLMGTWHPAAVGRVEKWRGEFLLCPDCMSLVRQPLRIAGEAYKKLS